MTNKMIGNYLFPSSDTHFERWMLEGEYQKKQRDALFEYMEERRPIEYIARCRCSRWSMVKTYDA